jgi:hypothetical protein
MTDTLWTRRKLLALIPGLVAAGLLPRSLPAAVLRLTGHPDPRPGIDASKVLKAAEIRHPRSVPVFDQVREIPQIVDGIRCYCGCAENEGNYSLLSCFEAEGMAQNCAVCQGQARLAHRLHQDGWSLDGIRSAIDAQFADT